MRIEMSTSNSQKAIPIPVQPLCPVVYAAARKQKGGRCLSAASSPNGRYYFFGGFEWHMPLLGQQPQLQPQEDFPLRRSRIIFRTTNATKAHTISKTRIVPMFALSHSIKAASFGYLPVNYTRTLVFSVLLSL